MSDNQTTQLSSNEIEQLCLKAARGAGLSWGLAEEAGMAAAWLALRGVDGPSLLCDRLQLGKLAGPQIPWNSQKQLQCPIALGAALSDHAGLGQTLMQDEPIDIGFVASPALLLPFIGSVACIRGHAIKMNASVLSVVISIAGEVSADLGDEDMASRFVTRSKVLISKVEPSKMAAPRLLCRIPVDTIKALGGFAMRTTVQASDVSRAGAGASGGDAD